MNPLASTTNFDTDRPDTHGKALRINMDRRRYGTFAEIGAGQEVVRWFFRVGGAAGTIAKSMSAYDMTVSDAIYGHANRYVSRQRLEAMLDHEYKLNLERLANSREDTTSFFAFADTVSARNFMGTNDCQGWMGVRFQVYPRDHETQVIIHFRLMDPSNVLQQETIGIIGVNLLYGAFFLHHEPELLIQSLMDDLNSNRIEIDLIEFSGIGFRAVDNRLMSLSLVRHKLSKAAMFGPDGKVLLSSELLYKKPALVERGSFRPVTHVNLDILRAATVKFKDMLPDEDKGQIVNVAEITMRNLMGGRDTGAPDIRDFLARADAMGACGLNVMISDFSEFYRLATYLRRQTGKPIGLAMGLVTVPEIFDASYYTTLEGGLLEALGRLLSGDISMFIYPYVNRETNEVMSIDNLDLPVESKPLYDYAVRTGRIRGLESLNAEYLKIDSRDVLKKIATGDGTWEQMVPEPVVKLIRERGLFGCKK
ncbi:TonB-dependent receptor [Limnoglobus roseus]|uniref:Nicotinate-nucleotide adenylyltransferase n=1 Tax=Limnoglobus roseus TaxID=2598579 RepID=A0A5C1AJT8_9BACT|nr:TonB-dependent receptor [Limnoglobus roseus]QEL19471.1 hypothetical protein PX52LOC_06544 [Limnoglobus roseus]